MKSLFLTVALLGVLLIAPAYGIEAYVEEQVSTHSHSVHLASGGVVSPHYAGTYGFTSPAYFPSWGKSPCGPNCWEVWSGYKTCHGHGSAGGQLLGNGCQACGNRHRSGLRGCNGCAACNNCDSNCVTGEAAKPGEAHPQGQLETLEPSADIEPKQAQSVNDWRQS